MFQKVCDLIGLGGPSPESAPRSDRGLWASIAERGGEPSVDKRSSNAQRSGTFETRSTLGGRVGKRALESFQDEASTGHEGQQAKRFRMGDLVDSVKIAANGVRSRSSSVISWVRNSVSLSLNSTPETSPKPSQTPLVPQQNNSQFSLEKSGSLPFTFRTPSVDLAWKSTPKPDVSKSKPVITTQGQFSAPVFSPPVCNSHKSNGHSLSAASSSMKTLKPKLGRSLHLGSRSLQSGSLSNLSLQSNSSTSTRPYMTMYEKSFPIRVVAGPSRSSSVQSSPMRSNHIQPRQMSTVEESVRQEEKEVYRQLLEVVSGNPLLPSKGDTTYSAVRSHRDLTSFLSPNCYRLRKTTKGEISENSSEPSETPSPKLISSGGSSTMASPFWASSDAGSPCSQSNHLLERDGIQDTNSQDTQSSAPDSDSVIFVKAQKAKKESSAFYFQAELWIKELTSMHDFRAHERMKQIEQQEALTLKLQKQRLHEEGRRDKDHIELHLRVPLEKEVPVTAVVEEVPVKPAEEEFPELTKEMEEDVRKALRGDNPDEILSEGFRLTITRKDIQTLSHLNWLNDEVINFYMNMLVERSKQTGFPKVHAFNTFFFPKVKSAGFSAVRRWTKKVDIFAMDILLIPVHLGVHWCLAVVDFRKKNISYFDSMGGSDNEACKTIQKYLEQESLDKKVTKLDTTGWVLHCKKRNEIPQQMNGSDCGMFTCKYADYITKDKPITFTQKHMPYFRRRMVWEILNKKLL
ncbi:sentrin-specific protease 1 [Polypterus senegalus]|uniref:sentrin-specific protease 1 n=1 Tax=Polypterus senegalus TaxID=55291 RepID=UPI0019643ADD|nr:sentrin-specific protease 1 [Polypterus senegalus]